MLREKPTSKSMVSKADLDEYNKHVAEKARFEAESEVHRLRFEITKQHYLSASAELEKTRARLVRSYGFTDQDVFDVKTGQITRA